MKYCPTCKTRYDEEILRFCMKDGTPLLEEEEPNFITMPSENAEDSADDDEVTVIRRNTPLSTPTVPVPPPPVDNDEISFAPDPTQSQRIVIPTTQEPVPQPERARVLAPYQQTPKSSTAKVIFLTMLGTIGALAIAAAGFWYLQDDQAGNTNVNASVNANITDVNTNLNTNLGIDGNFNFNTISNSNINANSNTYTNVRTPTPTPTSTPRPSPSRSVSPSPSPTVTPDDNDSPPPTRTPIPTPTPIIIRPGQSPTPRMNSTPSNRNVNSGL